MKISTEASGLPVTPVKGITRNKPSPQKAAPLPCEFLFQSSFATAVKRVLPVSLCFRLVAFMSSLPWFSRAYCFSCKQLLICSLHGGAYINSNSSLLPLHYHVHRNLKNCCMTLPRDAWAYGITAFVNFVMSLRTYLNNHQMVSSPRKHPKRWFKRIIKEEK